MRMKRFYGVVTAVGVVSVALATTAIGAGSSQVKLQARMSAAQQDPPQVVTTPDAAGRFTAMLTRFAGGGGSLSWRLTYEKLSSPATFSYIFVPKRGKLGELVIQLCKPCRSGAHGTLQLSPSVMRLFASPIRWVNIRTKRNPKGEIRGKITTVAPS